MPLLSEIVNDINAEQDALMLKDRMKAYALQYKATYRSALVDSLATGTRLNGKKACKV